MAETGNYAALQSLYRGVSPYALAGLTTVPNYGAAAAAAAAAAANNGSLFGAGGGTVSGPTEVVSSAPPSLASSHTATMAAIHSSTPSLRSTNNMEISPALEIYYRQVQAITALQKQPHENIKPTSSRSEDQSLVAQVTAKEPSSSKTSILNVRSHMESSAHFEDSSLHVESSSFSPIPLKRETEPTADNCEENNISNSSSETNKDRGSETRTNLQLPLKPTPIVATNSSQNI